MKKLLILLLALTAIAWAEIEIEVVVRIENLPEKILDLDGFSSQNEYCADWKKTLVLLQRRFYVRCFLM